MNIPLNNPDSPNGNRSVARAHHHWQVIALLCCHALAALPAAGDPTEYTTPIGYETIPIHKNSWNLLSGRLLTSTLVAGVFESVGGHLLVDSEMNFGTVLSHGVPYLVELTGGSLDGLVVSPEMFVGDTLTVSRSLPAGINIFYQIRRSHQLSDVVSPAAVKSVADFNPDGGDQIFIHRGGGLFDRYFVSSHPDYGGYFNAETGLPEDPRLDYTEAILYWRQDAADTYLVVTGEVKLQNTSFSVIDLFNYFGTVNPVVTLASSGLSSWVQAGTVDTADIIWLQGADGKYQHYYYSNGEEVGVGWRLVTAYYDDVDRGGVEMGSGMIIERRAPDPYDAIIQGPPVQP